MKEKLENLINEALKNLSLGEFGNKETGKIFKVEYSRKMDFGDYSTNVGIITGQTQKIVQYLNEHRPNEVDKVEEKVGFINFFLKPEYFNDVVKTIDPGFGKSEHAKGYKVMMEYTDANPFKEFHIGHLMSNTIGESVARVVEANGAEVKRANYQGDVGLHVAKAVWAMKKGAALMNAYADGHKAYEEGGAAKEEIIEINKKIYDHSDPEINDIYEEGRQASLLYFEVMYKKLGMQFDFYFFESEVADFGKETVEKNIPAIFEKSDGAVVFKGENYDKKLHTRVFINKEGLPTYEAKELGLSKYKFEQYPYNGSIVITGNEINEYFKVLLKAMSLVFPDLAAKTKHLSHGMLRLPQGKMSSRTGNVITADSLINQVKDKVKEKIDDNVISEEIAIGAIKYSILRQAIGGDIIFDFDKSISFEGDSGPYLQYSVVRAKSLLKKSVDTVALSNTLPDSWGTTNLERYLERFPSVVAKAGMEYAPHYIATYLIELAGEFNSFYASHKIIDPEDPTSPYRLTLTKAFADVMESGLTLLGIQVPERM